MTVSFTHIITTFHQGNSPLYTTYNLGTESPESSLQSFDEQPLVSKKQNTTHLQRAVTTIYNEVTKLDTNYQNNSITAKAFVSNLYQLLISTEKDLELAENHVQAKQIKDALIRLYQDAFALYSEDFFANLRFYTEEKRKQQYIELLELQFELAEQARANAITDEQRIVQSSNMLSIKSRIAKLKNDEDELVSIKNIRKEQLRYQRGAWVFAGLYGVGQGAAIAGFTVMLIGLAYFMSSALIAAFGWPSLLLIVAALPLLLSTASNYWIMRKDMAIMGMKLYYYFRPEAKNKQISTREEVKMANWRKVLSFTSAILGGLLISALTAYGMYLLLPGETALAVAAGFFMITVIPEIVLNINNNKKFWASPYKHFKDAYHTLTSKKGNHYFARLMGWFTASLIGMGFTAMALTSLGDLMGVPFAISFPILCTITVLNISFYYNRAYDHVSHQRDIEEGIKTKAEASAHLTTRFKFIRVVNGVGNGLIAVLGFLATADKFHWIIIKSTSDLSLSNVAQVLDFGSPAVLVCLGLAFAVGVLAFLTSYIANAAGEQQGYEQNIQDELNFLSPSPAKKLAGIKKPSLNPVPKTLFFDYGAETTNERCKEETFELSGFPLLKRMKTT